ncbi:hypothetical protein GT755_10380 [Herbidospora sp. NEAU-GS84]|uniref:Aminoglycoside phosphotransferase domain-containing protein n=1 Tax=Herbidospora solisilvae TaxID=2696284 RepID=A0A7C9N0C8_9ACTN|nr:aminoglycoside phosphotransferase family protein [Herbidospora solisilvae]NAS22089.1 hypothetical protein [Herbidospora solisilvae]
MKVFEFPDRLIKSIVFLRGEDEGQAWIAALPRRIGWYANRWELTVQGIAEGGAMSCCVFCTTADGVPAVLKIPLAKPSGRAEIRQLERLGSSAAVPLIVRRANSSGVFLMSRILPGTTAWPINGIEDSRKYGDLLRRLTHSDLPVGPRLKDLSAVARIRLDWARQHFANAGDVNDIVSIGKAERVLDVLLRTATTRHVLHADLQAKNILEGPDGWCAIDPLGAIGDINAEAALWVAFQNGPATTEDRLNELHDHELLDGHRLRAWTYFFSVTEYRPYLPASAYRIEEFLRRTDPQEMISRLRERPSGCPAL